MLTATGGRATSAVVTPCPLGLLLPALPLRGAPPPSAAQKLSLAIAPHPHTLQLCHLDSVRRLATDLRPPAPLLHVITAALKTPCMVTGQGVKS